MTEDRYKIEQYKEKEKVVDDKYILYQNGEPIAVFEKSQVKNMEDCEIKKILMRYLK